MSTGNHTDVITMPKSELAAMLAAAVAEGIEKAGLASNKTNKSSSAGTGNTRPAAAHNFTQAWVESEHAAWLDEHFPVGSNGKRRTAWAMGITEETATKHRDGKGTNCKLCKSGGHEVESFVGAITRAKLEFKEAYEAFLKNDELVARYRAASAAETGKSAPAAPTTTTTASNSASASNSSSSSDSSSTGSSKSSAGKDEGQKKKDITFLKDKGVDTKELARLSSMTPAQVTARKEELKALWHSQALKATAEKLEKQKAATQAKHDAADCHKLRTWHHQRSTVKNGSCLPYEGLDLAALRESKAKYMAPGHKPYSIITKDEAPPMTAPASNSSASNSSASASASVEHEAEEGPVYEREEVDDVAYLVEQGTGRAYEIDEDGTRGAYVGELVMDAEGVLSIDYTVEEGV
jgi:hypothetical protein